MARRDTAARRYAEAAFQIGRAEGSGALDRWQKDLTHLAELLAEPELQRIVEHPAIAFSDKERVVRRLAGDASAGALRLVLLMVRRGRPGAIAAMVEHFGELLRRERGIVRAEVRTALPLRDEERSLVVERLRALTERSVEIREEIDASLIGGIAVRIGDRLYDASVRSRLERLRTRLVGA